MDSILLVGNKDEKLGKFLKKMGYELTEFDGRVPLKDLIGRTAHDLIIFDTSMEIDGPAFCQMIRSHDNTRTVPIVCLADRPRNRAAIKELGLERVDVFDAPYQIGRVVSSIATQLRMTKNAGRDDRLASLHEANAALRDLTMRFQKELKEARSIQEGLLPQELPQDPRCQIAYVYQPLDEVGGDWFFIEKRQDDRFAMQIADVTGHGLGAAFVGSMTKLALSAASPRVPHELLQEMNRLMAPQLPPGRFVTMGSYLYDPATGTVEYARAGHPPAFVYSRKKGEVRQLMGDGFPIGFFPDSQYTGGTDTLEPGDLFLAITDGISEAQDKSFRTYGFDRLTDVLKRSTAEQDAQTVRQMIMDDMNKFRDGRIIKDDVTMFVLKRVS